MLTSNHRGGARLLRGSGRARPSSALARQAITVLHVDDDPNDKALLRAAARKAALEFILHTVEDGEGAIAYLSGRGIYADRCRFQLPSLILLDLKMPRVTGF